MMTQPQPQPQDQAIFKEAMDDFDRFEDFFQARWKLLLYLCVLIVVLVGAGSWGVSVWQANRTRVAVLLGEADTPETIRAALTEHRRHPAAGQAHLRLVSLLFEAEKTEEALTEVRALIAAQPAAPEVLWRARLNEACMLETLGRDAEAAEAYDRLAQEMDKPEFVRDEANVNAARMYLALGQPDRAKACLRNVNTDKGYTAGGIFWAEQAKTLLQRIP